MHSRLMVRVSFPLVTILIRALSTDSSIPRVRFASGVCRMAWWLRDPFLMTNPNYVTSDHHAHVTLFGLNMDLKPGEDLSVITGEVEDAEHRIFPLTIEYAGHVPQQDWLNQIIIKLPSETTTAGDLSITIKMRGVVSNRVIITVRP